MASRVKQTKGAGKPRAARPRGPETSPAAGTARKVLPVSPLAPARPPRLPALAGVRIAALEAGIRYRGRPDLMVMLFDPGTRVAGVFTRSKTASAPVDWCRAALRAKKGGGEARAVIVNAGNANAFTGRAGDQTVRAVADAAAEALGCHRRQIYQASTGVIGEPLAAEKITAHLPAAFRAAKANDWAGAARAIMTTDTFPKLATARAEIGGAAVRINGIAKGSGMIAPDLATMLAFIATDAALPQDVLSELLREGAELSFNATTVDSDTSTSDTVLAFATGRSGPKKPVKDASDPRLAGFRAALFGVMRDLALQVVRDGEGAQKLIEITVTGAASDKAAKRIALTIANSPLVKTAIAGEDANWGRIVMAVGKSGEKADRDRLAISIGGVAVAKDGARVPDYDEAPIARHMKGREIAIAVDVGVGKGQATVWTCDLTHGYISINADYRS
jgi:glutamate N-acetyltransferase/amino-acid N-acetyltransferase